MKTKNLLLAVCIIANCLLPIANSFSQGAWIQKANFPAFARAGAIGFSIGTKGYLGTGWDVPSTTYYQDFW